MKMEKEIRLPKSGRVVALRAAEVAAWETLTEVE